MSVGDYVDLGFVLSVFCLYVSMQAPERDLFHRTPSLTVSSLFVFVKAL